MKSRVMRISFFAGLMALVLSSSVIVSSAAEIKIGYVDLRRAFYEYEKAQELDNELNEFAEANQEKRDTMVADINRLRDEAELLSADARASKHNEMEMRIRELQEFDMQSRQIILERKDDLFRKVMADIQEVVVDKGEAGGYDYILDSRNIMYADEKYDMTQEVIAELNR